MKFFRLAEIRELNDLTQRSIAIKMQVSKSTYARWETLEQYIPLNRLNDFCNLFDCSMDYATNLSNVNKKTTTINKLDYILIGQRIKYTRKHFKLTQTNIADDLNTSHSTISAYENGKTIILTIFAIEICKKYKVSLDWLCGRSNEMFVKN